MLNPVTRETTQLLVWNEWSYEQKTNICVPVGAESEPNFAAARISSP